MPDPRGIERCLLGGRTGTYPVILESLMENRVGVAANAVCLDTDYHREAVRRFLAKQPLAFDWDRLAMQGQE